MGNIFGSIFFARMAVGQFFFMDSNWAYFLFNISSIYFCQDGSGAISSQELLGVMRAMGQNPTEDEVS